MKIFSFKMIFAQLGNMPFNFLKAVFYFKKSLVFNTDYAYNVNYTTEDAMIVYAKNLITTLNKDLEKHFTIFSYH